MSVQSYAAGNKIYGFGRSNPTSGPVDPIGYRERDMLQNTMQAAIARRQPVMAPGGGNPVAGRLPPQAPMPMAGGLPPQHIVNTATPTGALVSTVHQPAPAPAGYIDPAGHGMGGGIPGVMPGQMHPGGQVSGQMPGQAFGGQMPGVHVGVGAPPVAGDSHGVPSHSGASMGISAPIGPPPPIGTSGPSTGGGAGPTTVGPTAPNFNAMGDATYERNIADLAMQQGQAQRQYGDATNNLEGDIYGRQRDINSQAPQTYQDLLEHFAGRGMAHSGTYVTEDGTAHNNVANQLADLGTKLNDGRNSLLNTLTGANDNYNSRLAAEREALGQRLGNGVLGTGLGKLASNSSSDYNNILKSIAGVGKSISPSSFTAPGKSTSAAPGRGNIPSRTTTPSRTVAPSRTPVRTPVRAPTLGKKR